MDGLLDFIKTPEGQGLLAAGFGGLANARRGAPLNMIGGAGLAGLQGYAGAQDRQLKMAEDAQMKQLREQQIQQAKYANEQMATDRDLTSLAQKFYQPAQSAMPAQQQTSVDDVGQIVGGELTPAREASAGGFDQIGFLNAAKGINPIKAAALAKSLQGEQDWKEAKTFDANGNIIHGYVNVRSQNPSATFKPLDSSPEKLKGISVGDQLRNPVTGATIGEPAINPNKPFSVSADGKMIPNQQYIDYELSKSKAGASRTSNVINNGGKAFDVELGKLDAKQLGDWRDAAQTAQNTLSVVQNLRDAEKQGAYSGGGANAKLFAANMIEGFTGAAPKGLVGSQLYNAEASKLVLDHIKTLGANPSNADREFIQKTVPQLNTNANARAQMAQWMELKANQAIKTYQDADTYARQNQGLGGFNVIRPMPSRPSIGNTQPTAQPKGWGIVR